MAARKIESLYGKESCPSPPASSLLMSVMEAAKQEPAGSSSPDPVQRDHLASQSTSPGAVAVNGPNSELHNYGYDDDTVSAPSEATLAPQSSEDPMSPVTAELVDAAEEDRKRQKQVDKEVEWKLAEREKKAPIAEIVGDLRHSRRLSRIGILLILLLLAAVAIVLGTVLPRVNRMGPPSTNVPSNTTSLSALIDLLSNVSFDKGAALKTNSTPQNDALHWLSGNGNLESYSDEKKIQRYALATLFYSTKGENWINNDDWLSDFDECGWYSTASWQVCSNGAVEFLTLAENRLDGTIPGELGLLSDSLRK